MITNPNPSAAKHQQIYDMSRYEDLLPWGRERDNLGKYISIDRRRPGVPVNLARTICNTARDFLLCHRTFPQFTSEDQVVRSIAADLRDDIILPICQEAGLHAMVQGSAAVTFGFVRGVLRCRAWPRTQAHPIFDDAGQLLALIIVYQGLNPADGKPAHFRITLDSNQELWEINRQGSWENLRPAFEHRFGFVPAIWIRHFGVAGNDADGTSLLEDLGDPLRAYDYSYSRENRALNYTADPTMALKDKDPDKLLKDVVRSPAGSILLGENGDVKYLEIEGTGLERMAEFRRDLRKGILECARVVIMDSEKITGANLSGYALTVLHRPMIDLADSLKPAWNQALTELLSRILLASSILRSRGQSVLIREIESLRIPIPAMSQKLVTAWHPWTSRNEWPEPAIVRHLVEIGTHWGLYFAPSPAEYQITVSTAANAHASELASQETAVRMIAPITGVEPTEEVERIRNESITV